jgi:hypothetical protein
MGKNKKTVFIILAFSLLIGIIFYSPTIIAHFNKYLLDRNKEVVTETKVMSFDEFYTIVFKQMKLAQRLESSTKYSLVGKEVRDGYEEVSLTLHFLHEHPEIKNIKIELPITRYQNNEETIEFISGQGNILEVYSKGKWEPY